MRDDPEVWRLSFILPDRIAAFVAPGRVTPCLHGCRLDIEPVCPGLAALGRELQAIVLGPSRERTFDQARRFLASHRDGTPMQICAVMRAPRHVDGRGGSDTVWIVVGAAIVFCDQPHPPYLPEMHVVPDEHENVVRLPMKSA